MRKLLSIGLLLGLAAFPLPRARAAQTIHVGPTRLYKSIQAGINNAQNFDEVVVDDGTYTGAGNQDITLQGFWITVRSANGRTNCIIDPANGHRAFILNDGESEYESKIIGFTLQGGSVTGTADGGAIKCYNGAGVHVEDCIIKNNSASGKGGAVYIHGNGSAVRFFDCIIESNSAGAQGGGVGVHTNASAYFEDCEIRSNWTDLDGGGIWGYNCNPIEFQRCKVWGNWAEGTNAEGGGIYLEGAYTDLLFENGLIYENTSANGGGICVKVGRIDARNSVINNNHADASGADGGGIYGQYASLLLDCCTIYDNDAADWTGGIYGNSLYTIQMSNTIVWGNSSGQGLDNNMRLVNYPEPLAGDEVDCSYCILGNNPFLSGDYTEVTTADPLLGLGSFGLYYVPSSSSPAVDSGDPSYSGGATDVDGQDRLVDGPAGDSTEVVDIGAWEYQ